METQRTTMNLHQKLLAISKAAGPVIKDTAVRFGNVSYKGISHDAVIDTISGLCQEWGVTLLPSVESYEEHEVTTSSGGTAFMVTVHMATKITNADKPEEFEIIRTIGTGLDAQDKHSGKAMSYAKKYAAVFAFMLITADGDETRSDIQPASRKRQTASKPKPKPKPDLKAPASAGLIDTAKDLLIETIEKGELDDAKRTSSLDILDNSPTYATVMAMIQRLEALLEK